MENIHNNLLKILVSFTLLYLITTKLDLSESISVILTAKLGFLVFVLIILSLQCFLRALKWCIILKADKIFVPLPFLLKSILIANFISLFLPTVLGGDLYRVYALRRYNLSHLENASSVIFDRIIGLFALVSISLGSYTLIYSHNIGILLFCLYIIIVVVFLFLPTTKLTSSLEHCTKKWIKILLEVLQSLRSYRRDWKFVCVILGISFAFQNNIILIVHCFCESIASSVEIKYLYLFVPLICLSEALPISINGFGVREGAFVFFFGIVGISSEEAFAVSMLVMLVRYCFSVCVGGSAALVEFVLPKGKARTYIV